MIALALDTSGPVGSVAVLRTCPGTSASTTEGARDGSGQGAPTTATATHGEAESRRRHNAALDRRSRPNGAVVSGQVLNGEAPQAQVLALRTIDDGMRRGVELFPAIEAALDEAGVRAREISVVAVGTGPGSYTGLRVGVTAARALAYATGAELMGVPSCDALAAAAPQDAGTLAVVVDARVRAVYVAVYTRAADGRRQRAGPPRILPPAEAAEAIPGGALVVGDALDAHGEAFAHFRCAPQPRNAGAPEIARLALAARARGEHQTIDAVVPLYLRKTAAERKLEEGRA